MARFEDLQELWQQQTEQAPAAFDARGLTEQLRRFGRNQTWINLFKVVVLVWCFSRILVRSDFALLPMIGAVLLLIGLAVYLMLDWRNQIGLSKLDFSAPSAEFVRRAHERLRHQLNPMRRVFWLEVVCIAGGFNLVLLARTHASLAMRIANHLTATALPFVAYVGGQKIREFRFKRECGAVMERLETLLHALEEHSR